MTLSALDREFLDLLEDLNSPDSPPTVGRYPRPRLMARDLLRAHYWTAELEAAPPLTADELKGMRKILRDFLGPVAPPKPDALTYAGVSTRRPRECLYDASPTQKDPTISGEIPELNIVTKQGTAKVVTVLRLRQRDKGVL